MIRKFFFFGLFLGLFILLLLPVPVVKASDSDQFAPDVVIVKVREGIAQDIIDRLPPKGASILKKLLLPNTLMLKVPKGQVTRYVNLLKINPFIEYAEPDYSDNAGCSSR